MEYLFEGDQLVDALLQEQTHIGWGSTMLRGRISKRWQEFHSDDRWSKRFVDIYSNMVCVYGASAITISITRSRTNSLPKDNVRLKSYTN